MPKPMQLIRWQSQDFTWACLPPNAGHALKHSPPLLPPPLPAANLQSPYAQVPCIPFCPRLDKKMARRKQGSHYVLDQCTPPSLAPDIRSLFFQSGSQGNRWVLRGQRPQLRPIYSLPYWPNPKESILPRDDARETVAPQWRKRKGWKGEETNLFEGLCTG